MLKCMLTLFISHIYRRPMFTWSYKKYRKLTLCQRRHIVRHNIPRTTGKLSSSKGASDLFCLLTFPVSSPRHMFSFILELYPSKCKYMYEKIRFKVHTIERERFYSVKRFRNIPRICRFDWSLIKIIQVLLRFVLRYLCIFYLCLIVYSVHLTAFNVILVREEWTAESL